jgi:hypothetical protein
VTSPVRSPKQENAKNLDRLELAYKRAYVVGVILDTAGLVVDAKVKSMIEAAGRSTHLFVFRIQSDVG